MNMNIAVDKCFLQGASKQELESVFEKYRVLMPEILFHELLTTERTYRARCFSRIPKRENPMVLVPNVGPILRWEVTHHQPMRNIDVVAIDDRFQFNPGLIDENYDMGYEQRVNLEEWKVEMATHVTYFAEGSSKIYKVFPDIEHYVPGQDTLRIDEAKRMVCQDDDFIKAVYNNGEDENWPKTNQIFNEWAIFKWLQIRLLGSLEYFRMYGPRVMEVEIIENAYFDLEYCLVGCICGEFATRDKTLSKIYSGISGRKAIGIKR